MTIYHGSYMEVYKPDVSLSRENVDFEKDFIQRHCIGRQSSGQVDLRLRGEVVLYLYMRLQKRSFVKIF